MVSNIRPFLSGKLLRSSSNAKRQSSSSLVPFAGSTFARKSAKLIASPSTQVMYSMNESPPSLPASSP